MSRLREQLLTLADGTRTIDEVAELTGCSPGHVRVELHRLRKEGHAAPMKRRVGTGILPLPAKCEEDYRFIAERLLEGWTMTQIAKYMKRDVKQLESYFDLLRG